MPFQTLYYIIKGIRRIKEGLFRDVLLEPCPHHHAQFVHSLDEKKKCAMRGVRSLPYLFQLL